MQLAVGAAGFTGAAMGGQTGAKPMWDSLTLRMPAFVTPSTKLSITTGSAAHSELRRPYSLALMKSMTRSSSRLRPPRRRHHHRQHGEEGLIAHAAEQPRSLQAATRTTVGSRKKPASEGTPSTPSRRPPQSTLALLGLFGLRKAREVLVGLEHRREHDLGILGHPGSDLRHAREQPREQLVGDRRMHDRGLGHHADLRRAIEALAHRRGGGVEVGVLPDHDARRCRRARGSPSCAPSRSPARSSGRRRCRRRT